MRFATCPILSFATSDSPIVPCSTSDCVFVNTMNGLFVLPPVTNSPTWLAIDATMPAAGAVSTALLRFVVAVATALLALSTLTCADCRLNGMLATPFCALSIDC